MPILRSAGVPLLALCALAACSTPPAGADPMRTRLAGVTQADLAAALADAQAQKDAVGALCWQVALDNLPALAPPAKAAGVASAIQKSRDLQAALPRVSDACAGALPTGLAALAAAKSL
jgi:hypothetical protein